MLPPDDERRRGPDLLAGLDEIDYTKLDMRDPFMLPPVADMGWRSEVLEKSREGTLYHFEIGSLGLDLSVKPGFSKVEFEGRNPPEFHPGKGFSETIEMYNALLGRFPARFFTLSPDPQMLVKGYEGKSRIEVEYGAMNREKKVYKPDDYRDRISFLDEFGDEDTSGDVRSLKVYGVPAQPQISPDGDRARSFILCTEFPFSKVDATKFSLQILNASQGFQAWNQGLVEWLLSQHRYSGVLDDSVFALSARALSVMIQDRIKAASS